MVLLHAFQPTRATTSTRTCVRSIARGNVRHMTQRAQHRARQRAAHDAARGNMRHMTQHAQHHVRRIIFWFPISPTTAVRQDTICVFQYVNSWVNAG